MPSPGSLVTLTIRPDPSHVRLVRLVAAALGRLNGIGEDVLDDVRLATGEACGRAVAAHLHHGVAQPVEVELRGDEGLHVCVRDFVPLPRASGVSAAEVLRVDTVEQEATQDAEAETTLDGLVALPEAIGLIEGVSDQVTVNTGHDGTTVQMRWARA
jgi:anti-sigma regulatory factor (Ser/Thr protein kinase)